MEFDQLIYGLQERLCKPLPGVNSHQKFFHQGRLKANPVLKDKTRLSAVLILLYPYNGKVYFPLILRPMYDGSHGGQMALPGGKIEPEDESLVRTALRETQEEIGVKAIDIRVLGELTDVLIPVSNFLVHPVVAYTGYKPEFFPDEREVDKIYEVEIGNIINFEPILYKKIKVRGKDMDVPGFDVEGRWVWGATSLILSELSDIISDMKL